LRFHCSGKPALLGPAKNVSSSTAINLGEAWKSRRLRRPSIRRHILGPALCYDTQVQRSQSRTGGTVIGIQDRRLTQQFAGSQQRLLVHAIELIRERAASGRTRSCSPGVFATPGLVRDRASEARRQRPHTPRCDPAGRTSDQVCRRNVLTR
jgi:hypothetical protein